ncbi:MAG: MmcQ/YjbR family DNA-binding protein [Acidobacteriota bacterium]
MSESEFQHPVILALRARALAFPEVVEGDSCVKRSFKVRNKSFLFLGEKTDEYNVMVKLGPALEEATALAKPRAGRWSVGMSGWTTLKFDPEEVPPEGLLERWLDESYRLQAPKSLLRELAAG